MQMLGASTVLAAVLGISVIAGIAFSAALLGPLQRNITSRQSVLTAMLVFAVVLYAEFFLLGESSVALFNEESDTGSAIFNYLYRDLSADQQWTHKFGGGHDIYAMFARGMELFSLERLIYPYFPFWLGSLIVRVSSFVVGSIGAYLIARRAFGSTRLVALMLAWFYMTYHLDQIKCLNWGSGMALPALAAYLVVVRYGRSMYWPGVILTGLLAASSLVTHSLFATLAAIAAAAILIPGRLRWTVVAAAGLVCVIVLVMWHEKIYAFFQFAPHSLRGQVVVASSLIEAILSLRHDFNNYLAATLLLLTALAALVATYPKGALRFIAALAGIAALQVGMTIFPWEALGLGILGNVHFKIGPSIAFLAIAAAASAFSAMRSRYLAQKEPSNGGKSFRLTTSSKGLLLATVFGLLIWHKGYIVYLNIHNGGMSQFTTVQNLAHPYWAPDYPFRVATLDIKYANIAAGFYGFDTFDGILNFVPAGISTYWGSVISKKPFVAIYPGAGYDFDFFSRKRLAFDIDAQLRLSMLGVSNVEFLFSRIPLAANGLTKVSGPTTEQWHLFQGTAVEKTRYYRWRLGNLWQSDDIHVYRLPHSLPRAFGATRVHIISDNANSSELVDAVTQWAPQRAAVVRLSDAHHLVPKFGHARVSRVRKVLNGYEVDLDAPQGGIVVLNSLYLPFWNAFADGRQITAVKANMVHMAVAVPAGTRILSFHYKRPLLREVVANHLSRWMRQLVDYMYPNRH